MKEFRDKIAVITGAASGIGLEIAKRCAEKKMKVVLSDIEDQALEQAQEQIKAMGSEVLAVKTDVSNLKDVEELAQKTFETFKGAHLLFNNAGVSSGSSVWESTEEDWKWVMGVNLWGVVYGLQTFIPLMLKQDSPSHIVNTASMAGILSSAYLSIYQASKHSVVTISESLYHELKMLKANVSVSVLCPGFVKTKIGDSKRNKPKSASEKLSDQPKEVEQAFQKKIEDGISTAEVVDCVFKAIEEEKFYILTHPEFKEVIKLRMEDILNERNPTFVNMDDLNSQ